MSNFTLSPSLHGVTVTIGGQSLHVPLEDCQELGRALVAQVARAEASRHLSEHTRFIDYQKDSSFQG